MYILWHREKQTVERNETKECKIFVYEMQHFSHYYDNNHFFVILFCI